MIHVHIKVLKHCPKKHLRKNRLEEKKMITHYPILRCGQCHHLTILFFSLAFKLIVSGVNTKTAKCEMKAATKLKAYCQQHRTTGN